MSRHKDCESISEGGAGTPQGSDLRVILRVCGECRELHLPPPPGSCGHPPPASKDFPVQPVGSQIQFDFKEGESNPMLESEPDR